MRREYSEISGVESVDTQLDRATLPSRQTYAIKPSARIGQDLPALIGAFLSGERVEVRVKKVRALADRFGSKMGVEQIS